MAENSLFHSVYVGETRSNKYLFGGIFIALLIHVVAIIGLEELAAHQVKDEKPEKNQFVEFEPKKEPEKPKPVEKPEPIVEPPKKEEPEIVPKEVVKKVEEKKEEIKPKPKKKKKKKKKKAKKKKKEEPKPKKKKVVAIPGVYERATTKGGQGAVIPLGNTPEGVITTEPRSRKDVSKAPTEDDDEDGEDEITTAPPTKAPVKPKDKKAKHKVEFNRKIKAKYPPAMHRKGQEGDVVAILTVSSRGKVTKVKIIKSAGAEFDLSATEAFKKFRFEPAIRNGKKARSTVRVVYRFRLDEQ